MDSIRGVGQGPAGSLAQQMRYFLQAVREVRSGQCDEEGTNTQTSLNYKLDMDERGVLKSASPKDSIRAVTNQEQMNVNRLSAEAMARGEDVISVDVDYKSAIVDGKLAIVAGHTEVVSKPRGGEPIGGGMYTSGQPQQALATPAALPGSTGALTPEQTYRAIGEANRLASLSLNLVSPAGDEAVLREFSGPE